MKRRIILAGLSVLILSCAKDEPSVGKVIVFNSAPSEIIAELESNTGLGETIQPGESLEFQGLRVKA